MTYDEALSVFGEFQGILDKGGLPRGAKVMVVENVVTHDHGVLIRYGNSAVGVWTKASARESSELFVTRLKRKWAAVYN